MNILGIDFEEWYHPELIKQNINKEKRNPSVINGIDKILDLLRKHETFATFFVVGELLEIQPDIFDKIIENDHEIGFHTMHHDRLDLPGFEEKFSFEVKEFTKLTNHTALIKAGQATRFGADWPGRRCGAKTRAGGACQNPAIKKRSRCKQHGDKSTGPRTPEGKARVIVAQTKHG